MHLPKIKSVTAITGHLLIVDFSDGSKKCYDVNFLLEQEMFAPLKNEAFFRHVSIEPGGCAVSWNAEIDISEYEIWRHGKNIS